VTIIECSNSKLCWNKYQKYKLQALR